MTQMTRRGIGAVAFGVAVVMLGCGKEPAKVMSKPPASVEIGASDSPIEETISLKRMLASRLATLLSENANLIDEKQPARQFRNRCQLGCWYL